MIKLSSIRSEVRVLYLVNSLVHGGAEGFACDLAQAMRQRGISCIVCAMGTGNADDERALRDKLSSAGIPVHALSRTGTYSWTSRARQLRRLIRLERIAVVHNHTASPVALSAFGAGVRRIFTIHADRRSGPRGGLTSAVETLLAHTASRVIAVSEASRRTAAKRMHLKPTAIDVIHNGVDLSRFMAPAIPRSAVRAKLGLGKDSHVAVVVARVDSNKGHDVLIRALRHLPERYADLELVFAGRLNATPTWIESLRQLCGEMSVEHRVHFIGTHDDVPSLLGAADVVVSPSYSESFGITSIEALAAGVPLVASDIPAHREVTGDGRFAWLAQAGEPELLAKAVVAALDDSNSEALAAARLHATSLFGIEASARKYADLYQRLLA